MNVHIYIKNIDDLETLNDLIKNLDFFGDETRSINASYKVNYNYKIHVDLSFNDFFKLIDNDQLKIE